MRKFVIIIFLILILSPSVSATQTELTAPPAPEGAEELMPYEPDFFWSDLWHIINKALSKVYPQLTEAIGNCVGLIVIVLLSSILRDFSGQSSTIVKLAGSLLISLVLIKPSNSLIHLGIETVNQISEYGKLLLPVMTTALAAQGGTTTSAALYTGTIVFNTALTTIASKVLVPMIYIYIVLCILDNALEDQLLNNLAGFMKWLMTWSLKIIIYLFTGYIGITGVISGTTDAAALKAAKLAFSGFVPVVGGIMSDASEAFLVGTNVMKNTVGVYGLLALLSVCIVPFINIGVQYILLKFTGGVSGILGSKHLADLIRNFTSILGLLLAMTGAMCLLFMLSTVCFMKGVA